MRPDGRELVIYVNGEKSIYVPHRKRKTELLLIGIRGQEAVRIPIPPGNSFLGKRKGPDTVYIPGSPGISRIHLKIMERSDGYYIEDQKSLNGTRLNGVQLKPYTQVPIRPGDRIMIADSEFLVCEEETFVSSCACS